jgi:hypothetical protein
MSKFAAAFGVRGRPGWSPSRLALVTGLQRAENLTDRQAAEAVRTRIDWQYLLGLPFGDPGVDHSVLTEFRARLVEAGLEQVALDALLARLAADGLVKAGGTQRSDSTSVHAAVAALNRLELVGESVRAVSGGPGRGASGLAGAADLRGGLHPPVRPADDVVAAPDLADPTRRIGCRLRP